ncbi:acyl-CoA-binding domain-containing protein 4 isoform X2 [Gymnodraco acuticeps]|uniref:Acyl-CoA-binding domain-containing protein 4 isoform X2 n=1 Tax=Gymnodraco acuticeps TaxID=8218 RepID=A0A6P8UZU4_GYMAC|nr:acyl-CoA-binding domain-containing protein 4 isoform X2 [Gymnodraco acuticeps]XP_034070768.1 acyl-CoA-binding domain-containing protein 4 isoform X2 [Gymnodraco acuticeps]
MPVLAMAQPVVDHQKRFQAAVDVIHNLPKNGSYQPSYEVMLRFYSLYKQAVCGPCTVPRPGFWDPVGRYKWDVWCRLGGMNTESAMAAYVDEMKKVAQEVIDSVSMNEKTASLFHHFEPLYLVMDDMPRPPEELLTLREDSGVCEGVVCEGVVLTSDSESEIFCDSVDSVEQLSNIKLTVVKTNGFPNGHVSSESCPVQSLQLEGRLEVRQVGAGQGGEGAEDGKGPQRRSRDTGREAPHHNWRERGVPQGSPRRGVEGRGGGAGRGGASRGGGDGSEGGVERLHEAQLQQQIVLALRRLREDMRSVMERLEAVERLAATHAQGSEWRTCAQCAAAAAKRQEERWGLFDVSGQTVLLFLLWPFVAKGLVYLLRRAQRRGRISS